MIIKPTNIHDPKILARINNPEALKSTFDSWDKEKLIQYALSVTKAISGAPSNDKEISTSELAAHPLIQGMALVEEIGQNLSSTLDLDEVLARLLRLANEALGVEDASIFLIEEPSGDLISQISLGAISGGRKFRVPKGRGIAGEVALTGKPIRVDNAQQDARHFKQIDRHTGFLTRSILCVPLKTRGRIIGVVEVFNKTSGSFTKADERILSSMANYAAISIENARLYQSVIAERDRVIKAQDEASSKLQRDLHDGPTQIVAAIQMSIEFCKSALKKDVSLLEAELEQMNAMAQKALHQMRTMLFELRPLELETEGLGAALRTFLDRRQKTEKTKLHLDIRSDQHKDNISRLASKYERALFAIVQEAVNNALKHAKANNIFVKMHEKHNQLRVTILDDGLGVDLRKITENYESRGSYGMVNLKERTALVGGELVIKSAPGAGYEINVTATLTPEMKQQQN